MEPPAPESATLPSPGRAIGILGLALGALSLCTPLLPGRLAFFVLGLLIVAMGVLENSTGFARRRPNESGTWFSRGGASIVTGLLLLAMPKLTFAALALLLGISWIVGAASAMISTFRGRKPDAVWAVIDGFINVGLGLAIALQWPIQGVASVGLYVGLRYLSAGWSILVGKEDNRPSEEEEASLHPDRRLGLDPHPYFAELREELTKEEIFRGRIDRTWSWLFLFTFFAIHLSRMDVEWNFVGLLSPIGAVIGDALLAIVLAYALAAPISVAWRVMTRPAERRGWRWYLARKDEGKSGVVSRFVHGWLSRRMRGAVRRAQSNGSATAALGWGLRTGLPAAAILMAVTPLWGVSWFFNTETWVTGAWEMWAEQRTDTWRVEMVKAVKRTHPDGADEMSLFQVNPEGVANAKDFSFVVIGDTGEGDASQHILRDQLLLLGQKPETKFLVVSSDVIYPSGSMKDYELKFYLPFKGFRKPIYAVPGNHDWYDALEAFSANFLDPEAARAAMRARREVDHGLTTTTETRIDAFIAEASRLRKEYQIDAAKQRAPYFEMHTKLFSLVAVDTGIQRKIDDDQMRWLDAALDRSRGKFKMAILGHPLYAAGHYQGDADEHFAEIHRMLKKHRVDVVMAGDTHDFEYYKESYEDKDGSHAMCHFVNGGGGAYLSIGTALSWPRNPPVKDCGFYPHPDAITSLLDRTTPTWKRPLLHWVKSFDAWPSSPEAVASAFSYDRAPFFQSFMEVRVEGSNDRVCLWLYGSNGRLRWSDLHVHEDRIPDGKTREDLVEFRFPLKRDRE